MISIKEQQNIIKYFKNLNITETLNPNSYRWNYPIKLLLIIEPNNIEIRSKIHIFKCTNMFLFNIIEILDYHNRLVKVANEAKIIQLALYKISYNSLSL